MTGSAPAEMFAVEISELAVSRRWAVGTAESLTTGAVAAALGAAPAASQWFRGGIVAYSTEVKRELLGVGDGPVVSAECAGQMARAAAELLGAQAVVATTGAGGPDPQDGRPAGTVFIAVRTPNAEVVAEYFFHGSPESVVQQTIKQALGVLCDHLG